jgi:serine protease
MSPRFDVPLILRGAAAVTLVILLVAPSPSSSARAETHGARSLKQVLLAGQARAAASHDVPLTRFRPRTSPRHALPYIPGHIVVKFSRDVTERAMGVLASRAGGDRVVIPHHADFAYVHIDKDEDVFAAAARMAAQPGVVYAEPDARVFATFRPNDPLYEYQWNFHKLDMERTWDINRGGRSNVIVAVVDSGVAYLDRGEFAKAPELDGTAFAPGYDFVWDDGDPVDMDGHGTHVTGTIAQVTNNNIGVAGMAFNVTIMPVKVLFADWDEQLGAPFPYGASTTARGIRFAADNGAKVINLSLGSFLPNTATLEAMRYAIDKGVFIAIAAGNEADDQNRPNYPAVYAKDLDGAMAVGAVDFDLRRAPFSNANDYVEIVAPGGDLDADRNDDGYPDGVLQQTLDYDLVASGTFNQFAYFFEQGTSMSTAHVTGFAALLVDQGVTNPRAIEAAIKKFATDLGPPGRDDEYGYGLLNPRATIRGLGLRR